MPFLIEYRVKGSGYFPDDMLRYNNARARTDDDAQSTKATPKDWPGEREVELVRCAPNRTAAKFMAEARWKSFRWTIVRVDKAYFVEKERLQQFGFDPNTLKPI